MKLVKEVLSNYLFEINKEIASKTCVIENDAQNVELINWCIATRLDLVNERDRVMDALASLEEY